MLSGTCGSGIHYPHQPLRTSAAYQQPSDGLSSSPCSVWQQVFVASQASYFEDSAPSAGMVPIFPMRGSLRHWARHNRNKNDNTIDLFCSSLLNIMCFSVFVQHRTTEKKIGKKKGTKHDRDMVRWMNKLHYIITCDCSKRPNVRTPVPSNGASPFAERMGPQCQT